MGEPAGKLMDLMVSEESSRIILIALAVFLLVAAIIIAALIMVFKAIKSIKGDSRAEFEEEREQDAYKEKVSSTQNDLEYLSELMVRLTETVNASNSQISGDVKQLMDNMSNKTGGCALYTV